VTLDAKAPVPVEVRPAPTPAEARAIEIALERLSKLRVAIAPDPT
jgi:hypothetical protein